MLPGKHMRSTVTLASSQGTAQLEPRDCFAAPQLGGEMAALSAQSDGLDAKT